MKQSTPTGAASETHSGRDNLYGQVLGLLVPVSSTHY
jgi:hypothetical protein